MMRFPVKMRWHLVYTSMLLAHNTMTQMLQPYERNVTIHSAVEPKNSQIKDLYGISNMGGVTTLNAI